MQKVVYSITKVNSEEKLKGVGYLVEGNLMIPAKSGKGNPYIKVFENVTKSCKPKENGEKGYAGYVTVGYTDVPIFVPKDNNYKILDYIETTYYVWYKPIKE